MDLNALRSALAVAEHGGVAQAHRATGAPRSTLSRHLAELERDLGARLIARTSRRLRLTAEGEALVALAAEPMRALLEAEERIRPGDAPLAGRLRVSAPVLFGYTLLGEAACAFARAHPGVFLEVVVGDRKVDLVCEGFDAAIRVNPAPDSLLTGRLLGRNRLLLVATPALAGAVGARAEAPQATAWPAVVREGWGDGGRWEIEQAGAKVAVQAVPRLSLSTPLAMLDAVLAGVGAALLPRTLVQDHLDAGRLVALGPRFGPAEEVWLLHAAGRLPSRRLLALVDILLPIYAGRETMALAPLR
ncbi:MAG: LysR family transcriptional regulator [Caulobacteraceae bacterium]|nr:LysR family transcriptional regulator [Caulobacter sp.]